MRWAACVFFLASCLLHSSKMSHSKVALQSSMMLQQCVVCRDIVATLTAWLQICTLISTLVIAGHLTSDCVMASKAQTMQITIEYINRKYGSAAGYVKVIGITAFEVTASSRCAITRYQCTATGFRTKCMPWCSVLLCKTSWQQSCVSAFTPIIWYSGVNAAQQHRATRHAAGIGAW